MLCGDHQTHCGTQQWTVQTVMLGRQIRDNSDPQGSFQTTVPQSRTIVQHKPTQEEIETNYHLLAETVQRVETDTWNTTSWRDINTIATTNDQVVKPTMEPPPHVKFYQSQQVPIASLRSLNLQTYQTPIDMGQTS